MRSLVATVVLLTLAPLRPVLAGNRPEDAMDERITQAIDVWSADTHTAVTPAVRAELQAQAHRAFVMITGKYSSVSPAEIANAVPAALVSFLDHTQDNTPYGDISQVLQERIQGTGQVLPTLSDFPTLSIKITPPDPADFVVSIDGVSYPAGSLLFRVKTGAAKIRVIRGVGKSCVQNVLVTQSGPNEVRCTL